MQNLTIITLQSATSFTSVNGVLAFIIIVSIPAILLYFKSEYKIKKVEFEVRLLEKKQEISDMKKQLQEEISELKKQIQKEQDYSKEQDVSNITQIIQSNNLQESLVKTIDSILLLTKDNLNINNILQGLSEGNQIRLKTLLKHLKIFDDA